VIRRIPLWLRLAVAATLAAAAALAVLTFAITLLVHSNLVGDIDGRLRSHLDQEQTEDAVTAGSVPSPATVTGFDEPVLEWHTAANGQPGLADPPVASLPLPAKVRTSPGFHDVTVGGTEFRVLTAPMTGGGDVSIGTSLASVENATHHLRDAEILLEPLLLLMVFGGAFVVARRTLAPVERLRRTADAIDAESGDRRFRPQPPHDELGRLALTFDSMLDRLALARRRQQQLTADASHELRTPLSVLKGEAALALRRPRSRTEYRDAIERMAVEVERMEHALEDLLWLARVQQGDAERPPVDTDLSATAQKMVSRFAATATSRDLRISALVPDRRVTVLAPEGWAERLLGLLLDNACKYTPAGGAVKVWVEAGPPALIVEDTGPGIPRQDRERLLQRFERGANDATAGSGLGLAIADAMVRRCKATLAIGDAAGGGCRITISWPGAGASRSIKEAPATLSPDERHLVPPHG
jgi:signal transduction histidine kinase